MHSKKKKTGSYQGKYCYHKICWSNKKLPEQGSASAASQSS